MTQQDFVMVLTTVNQISVKEKLIEGLLTQKLAACIQEIPINSHYIWDGQVQKDQEVLLLIKSRKILFDEIKLFILQSHNYETPEVIMVPIEDGFSGYFSWINQVTKTK